MELPEAALAPPSRRAAGPGMGATLPAYLLARIPARTSAAQGNLLAAQGRAADRRDRQIRRGVRSLPARTAVRLPDQHSGAGDRPRPGAARRGADLQSGARTVRGAAPALPAPVHRLSRNRA